MDADLGTLATIINKNLKRSSKSTSKKGNITCGNSGKLGSFARNCRASSKKHPNENG